TGSTMSATGRMVETASTGSRASVEQPGSAANSKQIGRRSAVRSNQPSLTYRPERQLIAQHDIPARLGHDRLHAREMIPIGRIQKVLGYQIDCMEHRSSREIVLRMRTKYHVAVGRLLKQTGALLRRSADHRSTDRQSPQAICEIHLT